MTSKLTQALVAGVCALAISACSQEAAQTSLVGEQVGDFQLADQNDVAHELKYYRNADAIVLAAHLNGDEGSRNAQAALAALQAAHPNAKVLMINSSSADGRSEIKAEYDANGYSVPVLDDELQLIGDDLGFTYAGQAVVLDPKTWTIAFEGPATDPALAEAVESIAAGQPVEVASVSGSGAKLKFEDRGADHASISYAHDVAPILMENCVDCHREGGIGPFQMTSYDVIKGFSPMIREVIRTDRMPPYNADSHYGTFSDDFNLDPAEAKTLVHWIEAGSQRGDGEDPLVTGVEARPDWPLGEPDLVVDIPAYTIPASGIIEYQLPAMANPLEEGKWLKATTFRAGSREGVHHILGGWLREMPEQMGAFSQDVSLGSYAVGSESSIAPDDWGTYIPEGGALSFQMHYTSFGKEVEDRSQIGFYFADEAPHKIMRQYVLLDPTIVIEPNAARHHERTYVKVPADMELHGAAPHAHYRGYSSKLTAIYPDGKEEVLLNLPKYDFNWQREYQFEGNKLLPAGTVLVADYLYDNSAGNPANPDPDKQIVWGDQSFEEMLYTQIRYRWVDETADNRRDDLQKAMDQQLLFAAIDENINGVWDLEEMRPEAGAGTGDLMGPIQANFAQFDTDQSGGMTPEEVQAAMEYMQQQSRSQRGAGGQP